MADGSIDIRVRPRRVADLFCGAGGFSTGATRAARDLGLPVDLIAVNHWPIAIATHQRNHPEHAARTHCADLESARPLQLVPEGSLDLLLASPSCVFHSRARGGKPVHDQQRMDPWHVVRWCTELRVKRILVENVPEFVDWGPCSLVTGRPIASRRGEYFRAWCDALRAIGFRLDHRVLCSADYGDPTTRQRFFLIGRSDRGPLRWAEPTHARGGADDLLGARPRWRAAAEIIDWSLPGRSIFNRSKPLKPNTIRRILAGAQRYGWPQPYVDALQALLDGREPVLDVPAAAAEPMLLRLRGTHGHAIDGSAMPINGPLPTLSAGGGHVGLVMATGAGGVARDLAQPIRTVTAGGDGGARPHFVSPLLVNRCTSEWGRTARPTDEPFPTIATAGGGFLADPLLAPYYGSGSGETSKPVTEPVPTVNTKARFGLAEPVVLQTCNSGSPGVRAAADPLRTITTAKGGDQAVAAPILMRAAHGDSDGRDPLSRVLDTAAPLPALTGSNEVGVASPFLVPNFGERPGQEPRTHDIGEPLPTVAASGHIQLAQPTASGYRIDILYRMLNWRELSRAMSFEKPGEPYHFEGNATEITKQIGNAVSGELARAQVRALMEDA